MKKLLIYMMLIIAAHVQAQTLEECQQAAERNYPMIRQYDLIAKTTDLTVSNIQKGWLPQLTASAQATLQSDVTAFPERIQQAYQAMGIEMQGLRKDQYRVGVDVQQTVFDGGAISSQMAIAREQGNLQMAETEVTLYSVRRRVNEMYFGLLLLDEQIVLKRDLIELLSQNEKKLASMVRGGTAAESDYQNVRAERLNVVQQLTSMEAQRSTLIRVLSTFCGIEVSRLSKPAMSVAMGENNRPELRAIDAQLRMADAQERALVASRMPKVGVFAQGFYGYPGYNLFEDMMSHRWSLNGMIGARITWSLGVLYTNKNDRAKIDRQREAAELQRDVFLFNSRMEQMQHNDNVVRYQRLMADDEEIINLRSSIRQAAESNLAHGIIDVNDLVREISAENVARVQQSLHEIQMLMEMYDLKYIMNN